jgi:hypothetical protein
MKKVRLVFLFLLTSLVSPAQNIVSLGTLPANPTATDTIKMVSHLQFSSGGCDLQSATCMINGNAVNVMVKHCTGLLTFICDAFDTVTIGVLPTGTYQLQLDAQQWLYDFSGNCSTYSGTSQQVTSFTVAPATNVQRPDNTSLSLNWRPEIGKLSVDGVYTTAVLTLYQPQGSVLFNEEIYPGKNIPMDGAENKLLLYSIQFKDGTKRTGKLFLN